MNAEELLRRVKEVADLCADAERDTRGDEAVRTESWVAISHAARCSEELERDLRTEVLRDVFVNIAERE